MKTQEKKLKLHSTISTMVQSELLKDSHYHPNLGGVTRGGMANHFPMTILSLQGLGANDQEVKNFINHWPRHRSLIKEDLGLIDTFELNQDNWHNHLGVPEKLLEFKRVFQEQLNSSGLDCIVKALQEMKNSLPMGLFHPLIRLSFAMTHQDNGMIADALAYMAIRYHDLYQTTEIPSNTEPFKTAFEVWQNTGQQLESIQINRPLFRGSLNICEQFCAETSIQELVLKNGLSISRQSLKRQMQDIALLSLKLYLYQPALTTLHGVTACQALVDITQTCINSDNQDIFVELWKRYWIWLSGLFIEKGFPHPLPEIDPVVKQDINNYRWQELVTQARKIPEVHLIKMTYSCQWLDQNLKANPLYKLAVINMIQERQAHPQRKNGLIF